MNRTLLIIAGETSGDKHAANLVKSLKSLDGNLRIIGIGGDEMNNCGVKLLHHVSEMSVMGFSDVITRFPLFRRVRKDLLNVIREEKPVAVILVDYPGFNLRFARTAKKLGLKVIYYISPQVWAWGMRRIKIIRQNVDLMLTIFKFEEELYKRFSVNASFVGHPLMDTWSLETDPSVDRKNFGLTGDEKLIALLPGSRLQEVRRVLPIMLKTALFINNHNKNNEELRFVVGCAPAIPDSVYRKILLRTGANVVLTRRVDELIKAADAGIVTSGTATLECALAGLPIVVVYKTSLLNYMLGKALVKINYISLVNIVGREEIVPELIQNKFEPATTSRLLNNMLKENGLVEEIRRKYNILRSLLGEPGGSMRAAKLILDAIS